MQVSKALATRISCRAFLDKPVRLALVRQILQQAGRAPSGGNLQPWHVYVLTGEPLRALLDDVERQMQVTPRGQETEYRIYPKDLKEPYFARRHKCGEDLYATIGVSKHDKPGRLRQFRRNFRLFGAPVGLFFYLDRQMQPGQWSDIGMYLQSVMLLAREFNLHTCPQEAWASWHATIAEHLQLPVELMLFCGMALGHMDDTAPINQLRTDRAEIDEVAEFRGF